MNTSTMPPLEIDTRSVHEFWENRARRYLYSDKDGLSNLEPDPVLQKEKLRLERMVLDDYVNPSADDVCLDLGAGHGVWAAYFAPRVERIDCVEYAKTMVDIARKELAVTGVRNVEYFHMPAQDYLSERKYDTILLSGLLIYLGSAELSRLLGNLRQMLKPTGKIVLRDGTARQARHQITRKFSEALQADYSASYRTAEEYVAEFGAFGFELQRHQDMFPPESPLNKWKETVLRVYEFRKAGQPA